MPSELGVVAPKNGVSGVGVLRLSGLDRRRDINSSAVDEVGACGIAAAGDTCLGVYPGMLGVDGELGAGDDFGEDWTPPELFCEDGIFGCGTELDRGVDADGMVVEPPGCPCPEAGIRLDWPPLAPVLCRPS